MITRLAHTLAEWRLMIRTALMPVAAAALLTSCTDDARAHRILADEGYTRIQLTGYAVFACGRDDEFSTGFEAVNGAGRHVSGAVCCGLFKSCTVRHR